MGSFKDVVGHKNIIEYIQNAVNANKVSHAYILNGERGSGKKMLATLFAETLLCEEQGSSPCNKCHSCKQTDSGNHPDVIWVQHEKPNTISVDDIRTQLNNDIEIKPYQGPYKIYIVPEADLMTTQAQNALLKTLEEPPEYAVIFLLTENAEKLIRKYLMEKLEVPDYKADICTAFAQGNMGKAIMLAQSEHFGEIRDEVVQLLKYIHDMEISEIEKAIKRCQTYKLEINDYLDIIMIWYRDVLLYKATKDVNEIVFKDQVSSIKEQATRSSYEGIELILESLEKAKTRLDANVNFELVMELLCLTIKENG